MLPKTDLHLIVVGVNSQVWECLVRICHQRLRPLTDYSPFKLLGRCARWKVSPGTLKSGLTQAAGVGRTTYIHSFIHSNHFYSASLSPLLLRGVGLKRS